MNCLRRGTMGFGGAAPVELGREGHVSETNSDHVLDRAKRWLAAEPDQDVRVELAGMLDGPADELAAPTVLSSSPATAC